MKRVTNYITLTATLRIKKEMWLVFCLCLLFITLWFRFLY